MAESYSVKAMLSAQDKGFSSTLKSATGTVNSLASSLKQNFSFGILQGMGQAAFGAIKNSVTDLISEMNSSNAAWKTFTGNMQMLGKSDKEISETKKELQQFATQTIYSASDMATTYSQLAAVGTKNCTQLVKGFGGLAAAAENPQQAMKTLSQQATQMAAKPNVAWQDFKLMLEQTPAGIAAVAKEMGMSTSDLVKKVQAGEIATDKFFDAIQKVGTNKDFTKLATTYKTAGQAMDGLKETLSTKLQPAFEVLSQKAIGGISGIIDKLDSIDAEGLANKISAVADKIGKYWTALKEAFSGTGTAIKEAVSEISKHLGGLGEAFGSAESVGNFKTAMQSVADVIKGVAGFAKDHAKEIATLIKWLPAIVIGIKGFSVAKAVAPGVVAFGKGVAGLAGKGIGGIASKLFGVSKSQKEVGSTSVTTGAQMLTAAKSYALMGVAVLSIALGFGILVQSAIALANAGGGAIAVMAGLLVALVGLGFGLAVFVKTLAPMGKKLTTTATAMVLMGAAIVLVATGFLLLATASIMLANSGGAAIAIMAGMLVAIALLAVGAAALAPALTAGAVGLIAFGAAMVLVGVGAVLAATSLVILATALPALVQYGLQGALSILALGGALAVFAVAAAMAVIPLAALAIPLAVISAALILCSVAILMVGTGLMLIGTYGALAATGLLMLAAVMPQIVLTSILGAPALLALGAALTVFGAGALVASVGIFALSASIILLATGIVIAAAGVALMASVMPVLAQHGTSGAVALLALGGALLVFGAGALVAGAAAIVLGAGLSMVAVGIALVGVSVAVLAVGVLALGVAILGAAVGILAAAGALAVLNLALPLTIQYGTAAMVAMLALSAGLLVLGAGSLVAGAGLLVLGAGALVASAAIIVFGAAMLTASVGTLVMAAAVKAVSSSIKTIAKNAKSAQNSLKSMQSSVKAVSAGLDAVGSKAKLAMSKLTSAFNKTESKAKTAGKNVGEGFTKGMQSGLNKAPAIALIATAALTVILRAGRNGAFSAGAYISVGFAQGMLSQLGVIQSAANKMAAAADKAIRAKAKIHSPSKVADKLGGFYGAGYVNGLSDYVKEAWKVAEQLVTIPDIKTPELALAYNGELSADYEYYRNAEYKIVVPFDIDGKEFARVEASYMQDELDRKAQRENQ